MSSSLSDLKNAIIRELNNRTDLTTEIAAAINSAIVHYQRKKFWFSEESVSTATVANQAYITVPSDFGYIDGVTVIYSSGSYPTPIIKRDWLTMQELYVNSNTILGPPTDWSYYQNRIWFWPEPNAVYTVTIWQNFKNSAPSADADTSTNWTNEAEELTRSRAIADIRCNVIKAKDALLEFAQVAGLGFFSAREKIAYDSLHGETIDRQSTRLKPIAF